MHAELVYIDYWCLEVIEAKKMSVSYTHVILIKTANTFSPQNKVIQFTGNQAS